MPRRFDRAAFTARWRELCDAHGLDPADGHPRVFRWPDQRQQPLGRPWWCDPSIFTDAGTAHSVVEAAAITSIAAQARAAVGQPEPQTLEAAMTAEFRQIVREVLTEEHAAHTISLADLHRRRGARVEYIDVGGGFVRPVLIEAA